MKSNYLTLLATSILCITNLPAAEPVTESVTEQQPEESKPAVKAVTNFEQAKAILKTVYAVNNTERQLDDQIYEEIISSFVYNGIQADDKAAPALTSSLEEKSAYYLQAYKVLLFSIHNQIYLEAQGNIAANTAKAKRQNELRAKLLKSN